VVPAIAVLSLPGAVLSLPGRDASEVPGDHSRPVGSGER